METLDKKFSVSAIDLTHQQQTQNNPGMCCQGGVSYTQGKKKSSTWHPYLEYFTKAPPMADGYHMILMSTVLL